MIYRIVLLCEINILKKCRPRGCLLAILVHLPVIRHFNWASCMLYAVLCGYTIITMFEGDTTILLSVVANFVPEIRFLER